MNRNPWLPLRVLLVLWFCLGALLSYGYGFLAATQERARGPYIGVAIFGTIAVAGSLLRWHGRAVGGYLLAACGVVAALFGAVLLLVVGQNVGPRIFGAAILLTAVGLGSLALQFTNWSR